MEYVDFQKAIHRLLNFSFKNVDRLKNCYHEFLLSLQYLKDESQRVEIKETLWKIKIEVLSRENC